MSPAIQLLLIQIMQTVARLQALPAYQVICYSMGHVQEVDVRIYSADAQFGHNNPRAVPIARAAAHWHRDRWSCETDDEYHVRQEEWRRDLEFMRAALMAYLPAEAIEAERAA